MKYMIVEYALIWHIKGRQLVLLLVWALVERTCCSIEMDFRTIRERCYRPRRCSDLARS